ncbi:IS5 family transposase [Changchengzhania lutea]|uniref:IS5 family transposase n=1 Tax=Changchengzhania lutea TaxID=2049305 RepID=UPI00115EC6F0|nr:IS5 family transposase [Changchengzhania lutea]
MINYISERQLSIEEFKTPFQTTLLSDNRWVVLSKIVPWDTFASSYISMMNTNTGRPGISPRIVLGALIIKHMEKLDDRGVIDAISENPYMQFFIGLKEFTPYPVFDPSLFVELRKRVGADIFDLLNTKLISAISKEKDQDPTDDTDDTQNPPVANKGKLQLDATVADQYITYPTDSKILNECRKQCEGMIDKLYAKNNKQGVKPRTYRRKMDAQFLTYSKKKNKSKAAYRKMNRKLLECVHRDLKHIDKLLNIFESDKKPFPLSYKEQKTLWVIHAVYMQQKQMYDQKSNSCKDRIASVFQPHVRPIPRGKAKSKIEFGSKLGVSLDQGYARIDTFSWDVYNESGDLIPQVEHYKTLHGHYPELVQVDKIYATRENRKWLKERAIRITAAPLGRKSKELKEESYYKKRKRKKEATERNRIEGKFGQGKNGYNLNQIRATLQKTSESWIATIFFVMNLMHHQKNVYIKTISALPYDLICLMERFLAQLTTLTKISMQKTDNRKNFSIQN